jgi:hypothetical protein
MEIMTADVAEVIATAVREERQLAEELEEQRAQMQATERRHAQAKAKVQAILKLAGRERMPRAGAGKARTK